MSCSVRLRKGGGSTSTDCGRRWISTPCSRFALLARQGNTKRANWRTRNERNCRPTPSRRSSNYCSWFPEEHAFAFAFRRALQRCPANCGPPNRPRRVRRIAAYESPILREHRRIVKAAIAALPVAQPTLASPAEAFLPDVQTCDRRGYRRIGRSAPRIAATAGVPGAPAATRKIGL